MPYSDIRTNTTRLWQTIDVSSAIGRNRETGLKRLAFSPEDKEMRDIFVRWCSEAGCEVTVDRVGNIFARRTGTDSGANPVAMGSHLDTQINGGRYDGIVGVLGGLEVIRTLEERDIKTRRPVEVVVWSNEEGARFVPTMGGSAAFCGNWDLDFILGARDDAGISFEEALKAIGYDGDAPLPSRTFDAYYELHIEQGPILETQNKQIGVVSAGYSVRSMVLHIRGETAHVGPTPMEKRSNALVGAAYVAVALNEIGWKYQPEDGKSTTSRITAFPNRQGIISEFAELMIDLRHPRADGLEKMMSELRAGIEHAEQRARVKIEIVTCLEYGSDLFDPQAVAIVRRNAAKLGLDYMEIKSQAGHDAYQITKVAPTAMIFIPCSGGVSHNEKEQVSPQEVGRGVDLLFHSVLERANRLD